MIDEPRRRRACAVVLLSILSVPVTGVAAPGVPERVATLDSRELVDVLWLDQPEAAAEGIEAPELRVLVPGPRATAPGLYAARPGTTGLVRLCAFEGLAQFSFDRRHLLVLRSDAEGSRLDVRDPRTCALRLRLPAPGRTVDFDANERGVVLASRHGRGETELRLYDWEGRLLGLALADRNVELGLDPVAPVLHNFDHASARPRAFALPTLAAQPEAALPLDETAIPGSRWRLRFSEAGPVLRNAAGEIRHLPRTAETKRPLAASGDGRVLLAYRNAQGQASLWLVRADGEPATELSRALIDAGTISADARWLAWTAREGDRVLVWRHRTR